jgi:hypothetical protein
VSQLNLPKPSGKTDDIQQWTIYEDHENISEETKTCYYSILNTLLDFGTKLIPQTDEKDVIFHIFFYLTNLFRA